MTKLSGSERVRQLSDKDTGTIRHKAIMEFGEPLGTAYADYAHSQPSTFEERDQQRLAFAEAVINALWAEPHDDKVNGVVALLNAIEQKIAPVARRAAEALEGSAPIR